MRKIREKLCSESGASILLALLFFLLCAMVGASVLMAAASNAGKSRSNREEQQKYLTLSSALQLVCDELTAAEYTAKYEYSHIYHDEKKDEKGNVTIPAYNEYHYTQTSGEFKCGLSNVLPLLKELDWLFAEKFNVTVSPPDTCDCTRLTGDNIREPGGKHMLTLSVADQADKLGLSESVALTVQLTKDYKIYLSASLGDYSMYAELSNIGVPKIEEGKSGCDQPIKWQLSQITREEPT